MKNVAYCRSSEWQPGKVALQSQKKICQREAAKRGQSIAEDRILLEYGKSGRDLNRPKMSVLIDWIETGQLDNGNLFISSYDRLTRDLADLKKLMNLFDEHTINVYSAKEKIPPNMSPSVRVFYIHSLGAIAQAYLETCRQHALLAAENRRKEGKPLGTAPYGYVMSHGCLELVSDESKVVRKIFDLYLSGLGYKKICQYFTEHGVKIYGRDFLETDLYRILGNQTYAGILGKGNNSYAGAHQAIISLQKFERVQQLRRTKHRQKVHVVEYPLRKKICCPWGWHVSCHTKKQKSGEIIRYYECSNPIHRKDGYPAQLLADEMECQVLSIVKSFLSNQSLINQIVDQIKQKQAEEQQIELKSQEELRVKRAQLFDRYEKKSMGAVEFSNQLKQLKKLEHTPLPKVTVRAETVQSILITEKTIPDAFFFQLIKEVTLSEENEIVGIYLKNMIDNNLMEVVRK